MNEQELIQRALANHQAGRLGEAEAIYRQVLAQQPNNPDALHLLGMIAHQAGKNDDAVSLIKQAIAVNPAMPFYHANLGAVLANSMKFAEAIGHFQRALELQPNSQGAKDNLARAFLDQGNNLFDKSEYAQAAQNYRQAAALQPTSAIPQYNLGLALAARNDTAAAVECFQKAIELRPDYADAHTGLGNSLRQLSQHERSHQAFARAVELAPNNMEAWNGLGNSYKDAGDLDKSIECFTKAVELEPTNDISDSNRLYTLIFDPRQDGPSLLREARAWSRRHVAPLEKSLLPPQVDRTGNRRLRVGYLSPNFRNHSQAPFILPLLANHDHGKFEVFCYSDVIAPDSVTAKMQALADTWRVTWKASDAEVAELIRGDRLDILVDLTLHMADARPLVFARKPAPVQVAWLAYPGTTGLAAMDYRLTDAYLDPAEFDAFYTEKSIRLPRTFACFDPAALDAPWPDLTVPPSETNGFVKFGCLNNFCKINQPLLALWSGVLHAVPRSRLRLLAPPGPARGRIAQQLVDLGIGQERIEFVPPQPRQKYLEELNRIDICLDTLPYHGHTTSLDAMWMGVPVVTRLGHTASGRAGWSLMNNLNLTELVAHDDAQFTKIAAELAHDPPRLLQLRQSLRARLLDSPITDGAAFARDVEAAYLGMWDRLIHS